jgi:hypothetical protein
MPSKQRGRIPMKPGLHLALFSTVYVAGFNVDTPDGGILRRLAIR